MTHCPLRTRARAAATGLALLAMLALAGPAQAQSETVLTTFEPGQLWLPVDTDTVTTLGAFSSGNGWSSPQVSEAGSTLMLADVDGNQFLWLDGGERVRYTYAHLVAGTVYDLGLSFLYAAHRANDGGDGMALRITSNVLATQDLAGTLASNCEELALGCADSFHAALISNPVTIGTTRFTATGSEATIEFIAQGDDRSRVALDDVRVEINAVSAVPEPETWALMLTGLAAIGLRARRRRPAGA
ncbi:PEP-CTERM sorting domain-containing protein [Sphaerotilus mobilis]|uniref:Putative secreted protein with PEP-CTERM sorting signal/MYXO-CTERM domain-containing protein n=1 Tax=Sphaerotilus mobilis TaxID=47994 RepID=A0A4Q7LTD3_9BURK|nr:PEP-CTERM sorting domain-containing protein [Sphaerotilus mobilis]RZS58186.1 putative secreted protein with PEP-CTERM sorting signal/MYXO-CTERM domain-containing protein [Sphaerotilus mobilis]